MYLNIGFPLNHFRFTIRTNDQFQSGKILLYLSFIIRVHSIALHKFYSIFLTTSSAPFASCAQVTSSSAFVDRHLDPIGYLRPWAN